MRVSTLATMNCPRCAAPVKGDYKYCPECACRLRPEVREPEPETPARGPTVLVISAILLVLAGILVGWMVVAPDGEVRVVIPPAVERTFLEVADFDQHFEEIPEGIAWYDRNDDVLTIPPSAFEKIVRRIPVEDREAFLDAATRDPASLSRWGAVLSMLYERSEDVLWTRTREEPVYVRGFKCQRYEVTRGQYKEFLLAIEADPSILQDRAWVRQLWWGEPEREPVAVDPEKRRVQEDQAEYLVYLARRYRDDWWAAVLEHHRRADAERRRRLADEAFRTGQLVLDAPADLAPEERERRMRELGDAKFPPADPPERPAWLGPVEGTIGADELAEMSADEAIFLLVPPGWVRFDELGELEWSSDETTDDLPVTDVCYYDALMFIAWARVATGNNELRLPTWAEWTRAAHAGKPTRQPDDFNLDGIVGNDWPWGTKIDELGCNNRNYREPGETEPVLREVTKTYSWHGGHAEKHMLLNMAGNAAEWTSNIAKFYRSDDEGRLFAVATRGGEDTAQRAFACGGSYLDGLDDCKATSRTLLLKTVRRKWVGFRLVTESRF